VEIYSTTIAENEPRGSHQTRQELMSLGNTILSKENPSLLRLRIILSELTAAVMRPTAAPMFNNRIIKIIEGRSFSLVAAAAVPAAAPSVLLSMLNGSTFVAGAGSDGAGAEVLSQFGDSDIVDNFFLSDTNERRYGFEDYRSLCANVCPREFS